MPIEIRRFGVGHRRPDGPIGIVGLTGQVIHSTAAASSSELAFARDARIEPHANPNTTWFIVIEGGGWVGCRRRADTGRGRRGGPVAGRRSPHAAWTEHSEMRAFVVEVHRRRRCATRWRGRSPGAGRGRGDAMPVGAGAVGELAPRDGATEVVGTTGRATRPDGQVPPFRRRPRCL